MAAIKRYALCFVTASLCFSGSEVYAQRQSNFERTRNKSVTERSRPLYEVKGYQLGGFKLKPKVEVGTEFNDNIFATDVGKVSDTIFTVRPAVELQSDWLRHSLAVYGSTNSRIYAKRDNESTTDWTLGMRGRLDIEQAKLNVAASHAYLNEPRTSTNTSRVAAKPVRYHLTDASADLSRDFNYVRVSAKVVYRDTNYKDARDALGAFVLQDNRSFDMVTYSGRADVAISPDTALFAQVSRNNRRYTFTPVGQAVRDSDGWDAAAGVNFDITNLIRGEIRLGYFEQSYKAPIYASRKGLSGLAEVAWFPTQLTTVTLRAGRSVEETANVLSSGFISTSTGVNVDHELLRNVILSAKFNYAHDSYGDIDRTDNRYSGSASVLYMMNRYLHFTLTYDYLDQKSAGLLANPDYKVNRILLGAKIQY